MTTMMLIGAALAAIAIFATRIVQRQPTAEVAVGRDIFVPKNGDRGVIRCFEIPGMPSPRDEREAS
jgi:hypothetical protein